MSERDRFLLSFVIGQVWKTSLPSIWPNHLLRVLSCFRICIHNQWQTEKNMKKMARNIQKYNFMEKTRTYHKLHFISPFLFRIKNWWFYRDTDTHKHETESSLNKKIFFTRGKPCIFKNLKRKRRDSLFTWTILSDNIYGRKHSAGSVDCGWRYWSRRRTVIFFELAQR